MEVGTADSVAAVRTSQMPPPLGRGNRPILRKARSTPHAVWEISTGSHCLQSRRLVCVSAPDVLIDLVMKMASLKRNTITLVFT